MLQAFFKKHRLYYGWVILFVCFASVFFSAPGQTYFTSVFVESYVAEFGWSRSGLSSLYSLATLCSGLLLFFVGRLADKHGQKKIMMLAALVLGLSSFWTSQVQMLWMIFIGFFFGRFAGQGSLTMLPGIILPQWFARRRALAFSIMALGGAAGSAIVPPLNAMLIGQVGWRVTWRIWSLLLWFIFIPIVYFFLHNRPEEIGLTINDEKINRKIGPAADPENLVSPATGSVVRFEEVPSWQANHAIRTVAFWGVIYVQMLMPMIGTGITFHFVSIMTQRGIEEAQTPFLLSLIASTTLIATLLSGVILSKLTVRQTAVIMTILIVSSLIILLQVQSYPLAIIYAVIHGLVNGVMAVWGGLVWPEYFGTRYLGGIRGMATTGMVIASALGPIPLGFVFDRLGSHDLALTIMLGMAALGIAVAIICPRPQAPPQVKNPYEP